MKQCPRCSKALRAGEGKDVEKDGKKYRMIKLYCRTPGCPNNNGTPVMIDEVEDDSE